MRLKLELEITMNENGGVEVDKTRVIPIIGNEIISVITTLTQSTFSYNVITFNSKSELAECFQPGDKVRIKYEDIILNNVTIGSVKGRFSGLSRIIGNRRFFSKFNVDDQIELKYDNSTGIVEVLPVKKGDKICQ